MSPSSSAAVATEYKPLQACSLFISVGVSIFSVVDLCFFTPPGCIHALNQERVIVHS
jgi:hypothetical protein